MKWILMAALIVLTACDKKTIENKDVPMKASEAIISDRAQNINQTIIMLKLPTPALLLTAQKANGKLHIDEEQAAQIEQEQTQLISMLKVMSPEIKVINRYRMVLNAIAIVTPVQLAAQITGIPGISKIESSQKFSRPQSVEQAAGVEGAFAKNNSVKFIGSDSVHQEGIRGQGMKVGIIDTGIDYTHAMLGGVGTEQAYKDNNPDLPNPGFPNAKVVGGIDLVGTKYNSASAKFEERIPKPDENPLDQGGHGSHVAGTVAGIGDGVNSYSGVAPEASLYAIKVFGAEGSTNDDVVIAGLEYAADPNKDGKLEDQLDVVNMSLGSEFGTSHMLYREAIANLSAAGTVVVASAGNSGAEANIVGAPSVSEEAISVAASVDSMDHNWKFATVQFITSAQEKILAELIEGPASKKVSETGDVQGSLVFVGLANEDFSPEMAEKVKGKVALIDRGVVTFVEKLKRVAAAGAIGAVVANNQEGEAFSMGGDDKVEIPAVMITLQLGKKVKAEMEKGDVVLHFKSEDKVEKPQLIDTITGFSSLGPRSDDALIKPEISAPGLNIISAAMGKGKESVKLSGTSMSGPHIAGVMALMKQAHKEMSSKELKSLLMGTAKSIHDSSGKLYSVARMGAGRVQVDKAVHSNIVASEVSLSLGVVRLENQKIIRKTVDFKNISPADLSLKVSFDGSSQLQFASQNLELKAGESKTLTLDFKITAKGLENRNQILDGQLLLQKGDAEVFRIPVLAAVTSVSQVKAQSLKVLAGSELEGAGSAVELKLKNSSAQSGSAQLFNLLGLDERKPGSDLVSHKSKGCDLQAAGYRVSGGELQIAVKLYESMSTWNLCDISVLIDTNGDNLAEQELVGVPLDRIAGLPTKKFQSLLLDATKMRSIRKKFEDQTAAGEKVDSLNYVETVIGVDDMKFFNSSSVAIIQMDMASLGATANGDLRIKLAVVSQEDTNVQGDDYLANSDKEWLKLDLLDKSQSYMGLDQDVQLAGSAEKVVSLTKGEGSSDLMVIYPFNRSVSNAKVGDEQLEILKAQYGIQ